MKIVRLIILLLVVSVSSFAKSPIFFDESYTIKELAQKNQIIPSKLLHELEAELGIKEVKETSVIKDIGLTESQFSTILLHMSEELTPVILFGMFLWVLMGGVTFYLLKTKKISQNKRIILFIIGILFFGVFLHAKPGAMEAIVKLFKAASGKENWHLKLFYFLFFSLFGFVASHLFCSIGCQIGVVQDLIFQLFRTFKWKRVKISFWVTNGIRSALFVLFILFMFDIFSGLQGGSFYHNINIFKVYIWGLGTIGIVAFLITVLLSGFLYRPFCSIICPFGFWSWISSHFVFYKIKIDENECISCRKCIVVCPNNAMDGIYNKKLVKKECYSCGECINHCPKNCIDVK